MASAATADGLPARTAVMANPPKNAAKRFIAPPLCVRIASAQSGKSGGRTRAGRDGILTKLAGDNSTRCGRARKLKTSCSLAKLLVYLARDFVRGSHVKRKFMSVTRTLKFATPR